MFYKIQFKLGKVTQLTQANVSAAVSLLTDNLREASIVFDSQKNCLVLNQAAEEIFSDRSNISRVGDWIRDKVKNGLFQPVVYRLQDLPLNFANLDESPLQVAVILQQQKPSDQLLQELNERKSLAIREPKVRPDYGLQNLGLLPEDLDETLNFDKLTALPNHKLLLQHIEQEIQFCHAILNYKFALLFVDVNRFKVINSSLGRTVGDRLLIALSQRLQDCLRSPDFMARMGNDEFVILLSNIEQEKYAMSVADRIYRELLVPFNLDGYEVFIDANMGIAIGDHNCEQPDHLLRDAELALSCAKLQKTLPYEVFEESMRGEALTLLQLENDLRHGIERSEFILCYQPIIALANNKIKGFEVLIRWQHPLRGTMSPEQFIPLAEDTGLIIPLGFWILREACQQMYSWQQQFGGLIDWRVSVNISSQQLALPNFVSQVKQVLAQTKLDPHNLKLEITESSLVEDTPKTIAVLQELKSWGIEFSLDDFGTGYSSLSYLHQFPFDTLKIDRSFVNSVSDNPDKLGIVRAIITLARNLGMDTIAEGIETVKQLAKLKALKCEYGQGYYLSRPLNQKVLENLIAADLAKPSTPETDILQATINEQSTSEQLIAQIEQLRYELAELRLEKADLEIVLENATEHADLIESYLHSEICDRRKAQAALSQANRELEQLSVLDALTQVANRRRFNDYLIQKWQKLAQDASPLALILCDIDYFKLYNDAYGHPVGDYCLQQVALAIECVMDIPGLVARYGGEEFGVILPNVDGLQALEIAEKIALNIQNLRIAHKTSLVSDYVTISLGVYSLIPTSESSPELLISLADKGLYQAKAEGRNQAYLYIDGDR
ncbi:MAG: diguanylate cyclase [Cyanobacteria bacterium J06621_12]